MINPFKSFLTHGPQALMALLNSVVHQSVIFGLFNYSPPSYIFLALTSAVRGGIIRAMPGRDWDSELSTFGKDTVSRKWTKFLNKDRRK